MNNKIFNISLIKDNEKKIFIINNSFFNNFLSYNHEIYKIKIKIFFKKKKKKNIIIFNLHFIGKIILICDISNNKFILKINKKKKINILFKKKKKIYNNYFILPFNYNTINISKYIYESILLMIPLKKIDPKIQKIIN
ncbi:MAG: hypothetical protein NHF95_00320 [Candidatus Shikimatogenerans sp. JK-2022]|nr:hypothetical protein [Candidatus Shikimatogenerans bostrichidophilus]